MNEFIPSWTYYYDLKKNRKEYLEIINKVFDSGRLLFGKELENLERNFSKYIGTKYAIGCDNATNGIFLSLKTIGLSPGDIVITVANTAIPTVSAIKQAGATPKFVDVNKHALLDKKNLIKVINKKVKAIIPVHLYGFPCNMQEICEVAKEFQIPVIEDCSQAHGSKINTQKVGSFGDLSVFSFYPTKSLGGFGDAGIVCTNNPKFRDKLNRLRFYGIKENYIADIEGYNSRMDEIHAGILNAKLKRLDENISYRNKIRGIYKKEISNRKLRLIPKPEACSISNYLIPFLYDGDRDEFQQKLFNRGIGTNVSYRTPIYSMPAYKNLNCNKEHFPNTEDFCKKNISLPIFDYIPIELVEKTIEIINKI
tara:strand:+ start:594 stop:1694 length:1101 start_codon:yes stop_codon:yes gene_type:complete